jgi:hypothetical protein
MHSLIEYILTLEVRSLLYPPSPALERVILSSYVIAPRECTGNLVALEFLNDRSLKNMTGLGHVTGLGGHDQSQYFIFKN